jgi:hypothetical protein
MTSKSEIVKNQTLQKMAGIAAYFSIVILKVNGLLILQSKERDQQTGLKNKTQLCVAYTKCTSRTNTQTSLK